MASAFLAVPVPSKFIDFFGERIGNDGFEGGHKRRPRLMLVLAGLLLEREFPFSR